MPRFKRLIVRWDARRNDFVIQYPRKCDGHLAYERIFYKWMTSGDNTPDDFFKCKMVPSFADELKARGYDIKTMHFEVRLSPKKIKELEAEEQKPSRPAL